MKLYLVSQNINNDYDTYDSMVVSAISEEDARNIYPDNIYPYDVGSVYVSDGKWMLGSSCKLYTDDWVEYSETHLLSVEYLGETEKERGVILASYNAG